MFDPNGDERFNPGKAILAAATLLKNKVIYLEQGVFKKYGCPLGNDYWKFAVAAYNGGQGTMGKAIECAYDKGLKQANQKGLTGEKAINYAKNYAIKWDNIISPKDKPEESPLYTATKSTFPKIAIEKYTEISTYAEDVIMRASQ